MAKARLEIEIHQNTIEENNSILSKLRGRSNKIDSKNPDEWSKLFDKLNNINDDNNANNNGKKQKKNSKTNAIARQDQTPGEPIYGPIQGFPSGYWWGIRMDCSRDQVHSPFDKDIQEGPFGVASICTSHLNTTNDVDLGSILTFTGSEYTSGKMNDPLMRNYRDNIPLRLVRSYNLVNEFAPKTGYRYDGLYIVISSWIGVSVDSKKYHKFALARLSYQEPPSWSLSSKRTSQRISSGLRRSNVKVEGCGSLRCHMYDCQTEEPKRKKKKIVHDQQPPAATTMNVSSACPIKSPDAQRSVNESTIVMRHVSKKCELTGAGYSANVHGVESPIQIGNLMLPCSPKPAACKLQNANISIRTELYDSSPNPHQDIKKTTPMTICRIYKTNHVPAAKMTNSHPTNTVGTMNLNAFGPGIKDKINQESQIQSRSGISKVSDTAIASVDNCTLETISTKDNFSIKADNSTPVSDVLDKDISIEYSSGSIIDKTNAKSNGEITELKTDVEKNDDSWTTGRLDVNSRRSSNTSSSSIDSLVKKLQMPEAVVTIETLTPEQLLNLIVKKRYNPTGKLLIGSIIGLPAEHFTKTNESPPKSINNPVTDDHTKNVTKSRTTESSKTSVGNQNSNDKRFESPSKLAAVLPKKIGNENVDRRMRFRRLKRSRVTQASDPIEESNINRNRNSSRRLKSVHTNDKIVQPFSKSTTIKKRRGELANLVIDANFSTKIHSYTIQTRTMSRRLRSPTIILRKRKEFKGFITNYTKVELSKKSKRLKSAKKTKMSKTRKIQKDKREEPTANICRDFTKSIKTNVRHEIKRKIQNSIPVKKDVSRKMKRPSFQMVDAMTQCSLQKETLKADDEKSHDNNSSNKSVKIEWIDLVDSDDDTKFENGNESTQKAVCNNRKIPQFSVTPEIIRTKSTKKQNTSKKSPIVRSNTFHNDSLSINDSINNLSAFVPVNLPDGDMRIARLRSIGFKPIQPCLQHHNETLQICNKDCGTIGTRVKPTVIRRDVDEQYNKYTSEENNIVGYMDHELHYQDIEAEASDAQKRSGIFSNRKYTKKMLKKNSVKNNKPIRRTNRKSSDKSYGEKVDENDTDLGGGRSPWLGWNSYVSER